MSKVAVLPLLLVMLLACTSGPAQTNYAAITGVVKDSGGGVVPGVQVTIRHTGTNIAQSTQSNETGSFNITNLVPGPYELTGQLSGFRTYKLGGIVLETGQTRRIDFQLQVGEVTQSVDVTAEVAALNTEAGAVVGSVIEQQEIRDLPLDTRSIMDLALLVPGVIPQAEGGIGSGINTGGARSETNNFYIDGFSNRDARSSTMVASPSADAVQEFKMEVSGYSAESGRMAGGNMAVVLLSGTNKFHGSLFEFARNNVIDSRAFFDQGKKKLNRHQFGGTLHGPVVVPKIYDGHDRTFFLLNWESFREIVGVTSIGQAPTALERQGDFSQSKNSSGSLVTVRDPLANNAAFPNNRIPDARIHPVSKKILAFYPLPNRASANNNYITSDNNETNNDQILWKIDHRFDEKNQFSFRHSTSWRRADAPFTGSPVGGFPVLTSNMASLAGLNYMHLFSPTFLVQARGGVSRTNYENFTPTRESNLAAELGLPVWNTEPAMLGMPVITLLGYSTLGNFQGVPTIFTPTGIEAGSRLRCREARTSASGVSTSCATGTTSLSRTTSGAPTTSSRIGRDRQWATSCSVCCRARRDGWPWLAPTREGSP